MTTRRAGTQGKSAEQGFWGGEPARPWRRVRERNGPAAGAARPKGSRRKVERVEDLDRWRGLVAGHTDHLDDRADAKDEDLPQPLWMTRRRPEQQCIAGQELRAEKRGLIDQGNLADDLDPASPSGRDPHQLQLVADREGDDALVVIGALVLPEDEDVARHEFDRGRDARPLGGSEDDRRCASGSRHDLLAAVRRRRHDRKSPTRARLIACWRNATHGRNVTRRKVRRRPVVNTWTIIPTVA